MTHKALYLSAALCAYGVSAASAQEIDEIVVTAQQRAQSIQDVPLSVTALQGEFVEDNNIENFSDLALVTPGFTAGANYGFIRNSSMRGISNNQFGFADDPSIAIFVDDVYQGRGGTGSQVGAFFDVDRIEIIKGPQATLFGRSSVAGAINTIVNQPTDEFSAQGVVGVGERNRYYVNGVINAPLSPDFAVRVAATSDHQDGYLRNLNGGADLQPQNIDAIRVIGRYTGIAGLEASLRVGYERREQGGSVYQRAGLDDFTVNTTLRGRESYSDFDIFDAVGRLTFELSPSMTLTATTSWRHVENRYIEDYDGLPAIIGGPYSQTSDDELLQQDLKLNYESDSGLAIIAGLSYFDESMDGTVRNWVDGNASFTGFAFTGVPTPGLLPNNYANAFVEQGAVRGSFSGYSGFVNGAFPLTERLMLNAGLRYNHDEKEYTQDLPNPAVDPENAGKIFAGAYYNWGYWTSVPITAQSDWSNTAARAALSYELSEETSLYAQYSQGWKAGGIDSFKITAPPGFPLFFGLDAAAVGATPNVYDPEKVDSYEVGLRGRAFDRRFWYSIAGYFYNYRDLQQSVQQGGSSIIANVGEVDGSGIEAEFRLVAGDNWDLFANVAYNNTEITKYDERPEQVGRSLNQAPEWNGAAGATYTMPSAFGLPGDMEFAATINYRSDFRTDNALVNLVDSALLTNLHVTYNAPGNSYAIRLFVDNVFDEFTFNRANNATPFLFPVASRSVIGNPRRIGLDLRVNF